jgi:hypothetical protein
MLHSGTQAVVLQCDSNTVWHAVRRCVAIRGEVGPLMLMADLPELLDLVGRHATCSHCRVKVVNVGGNNIDVPSLCTGCWASHAIHDICDSQKSVDQY